MRVEFTPLCLNVIVPRHLCTTKYFKSVDLNYFIRNLYYIRSLYKYCKIRKLQISTNPN